MQFLCEHFYRIMAFVTALPSATKYGSSFLHSINPSLSPLHPSNPLPKSPSANRPLNLIRMAQSKSDQKTQSSSSGEQYWQGEWICVDCGYTYKPGRKVKFEDLPSSWKCPQCNAPKRRFAKKAGDYVAETAGTSNTPIVVFSILGLLATVGFGIWAASQL